jgi:pyridoxine/pyridoxamine 5'-phosphate oxidase
MTKRQPHSSRAGAGTSHHNQPNTPKTHSTEYFQSRPRGSQMGAWASNQSRPIASRQALEAQYEGVKVSRPASLRACQPANVCVRTMDA